MKESVECLCTAEPIQFARFKRNTKLFSAMGLLYSLIIVESIIKYSSEFKYFVVIIMFLQIGLFAVLLVGQPSVLKVVKRLFTFNNR